MTLENMKRATTIHLLNVRLEEGKDTPETQADIHQAISELKEEIKQEEQREELKWQIACFNLRANKGGQK